MPFISCTVTWNDPEPSTASLNVSYPEEPELAERTMLFKKVHMMGTSSCILGTSTVPLGEVYGSMVLNRVTDAV